MILTLSEIKIIGEYLGCNCVNEYVLYKHDKSVEDNFPAKGVEKKMLIFKRVY